MSLSCRVALYFLKWVEHPSGGNGGPNWVDTHIHAFLNVGGPLLGTPKTIPVLFAGEDGDHEDGIASAMKNEQGMEFRRKEALLNHETGKNR